MTSDRPKTKLNDPTSVHPAYRTKLNVHFVEIHGNKFFNLV